jgi:hypothetical protein
MRALIATALACTALTATAATDESLVGTNYTLRVTSDADLSLSIAVTETVAPGPVTVTGRVFSITFDGVAMFDLMPDFDVTLLQTGSPQPDSRQFSPLQIGGRTGWIEKLIGPSGPGYEGMFVPSRTPVASVRVHGLGIGSTMGPHYWIEMTDWATPVPEPATYLLALAGVGVMSWARHRQVARRTAA